MYINSDIYIKEGGKIKENLDILIDKSIIIIDNMTMNRIPSIGFKNLSLFQQKSIQKACIHIIEYLSENNPDATSLSSYWAGDIRINLNKNAKKKPWDIYNCGLWGYLYILQTGLMRANI